MTHDEDSIQVSSLEKRPVVRATFLSEKPNPRAQLMVAVTLAFVTLTSALRWQYPDTWGRAMEATPELVFYRGEYWRLITSFLIHRDLDHWGANALPLAVFTFHLFGYFGKWVFPVGMFFIGILVTATTLFTYEPYVNLLGISGVVYAMAGFWLTVFLFVERSHTLQSRLLRALGFVLVMLVPSQVRPEISYRAHAIGFFWGSFFGLLYFLWNRKWFRSREVVVMD